LAKLIVYIKPKQLENGIPRWAILIRTYMLKARLDRADLHGAIYSEDTIWSESFRLPPEAINMGGLRPQRTDR
jgi:hypothetical protein